MAPTLDRYTLLDNVGAVLAAVVVLWVLVIAGIGFGSVVSALTTLLSLALTAFVLWLLWRLVQAVERIADATEDIATESVFGDDD